MRAVRGIGDWEHYTKVKLEFVQRTLRAISAACASAQPLTAMDESRQRRRARGSSRPRYRNEAKGEVSHGGKGMLLDDEGVSFRRCRFGGQGVRASADGLA
jgi:hypothetical protein